MAVPMFLPVPIEQEPKKMNRFVLEFPTELGIESFLVQSVTKPKIDIAQVETPYLNGFVYSQGKVKYGTIEIKFLDVIGPSTTQKCMEWLSLAWEPSTNRSGYQIGSKKSLVLKALDPTGVEVEKWTLVACQIVTVDMGSYDMASDDISTVTVTVQPQQCLLAA